MKTTTDSATARPWKLACFGEGKYIIFSDSEPQLTLDGVAAECELREDAALIVRAVNRDHLFERMAECLRAYVGAVDVAGTNDSVTVLARAILKAIEEGK